MNRPSVRNVLAGLVTLGVFLALLLSSAAQPPEEQKKKGKGKGKGKGKAKVGATVGTVYPTAGQPIALNRKLLAVEFTLGLKDTEPTDWSGTVQLSEGRIDSLVVLRGSPTAQVSGNTFRARSVAQQAGMNMGPPFTQPVVRVHLDAPPTASVTLTTGPGSITVRVADLAVGEPRLQLDGRASAERQEPEWRLTGRATEDDYPALARGPDGTLWMASVEYQPGKPYVQERILAGGFEELVPSGNGDRLKLWRCDGQSWHPPLDVTEPGLDIWRPAVTVDGRGVVHVVWSQQVESNWDVYARRYTPGPAGGPGQWSETTRLTRDPGSDISAVATTDSHGVVWLTWMGWRDGFFAIHAAALADGHPWRQPRVIAAARANHWAPAIAADAKGNVYVAYDTYAKGNYDVHLARLGADGVTTTLITDSPRYEARPALACDRDGRVWVAYEEGDGNWGKDFAGDSRTTSLGVGLYRSRTVRVRCLADGQLREPADSLAKLLVDAGPRDRNESVPRLAFDEAGGLWLLYRKHPQPDGVGERWNSYAHRFDGRKWSAAYRLPSSDNQLDNRPALAPFAGGLMAAYSGDGRTVRTMNREQSDLFVTLLRPTGPAHPPELVLATSPPAVAGAVPHPDEAADVARIRGYRVRAGGKELRPVRGEFHRHTEYTAHRDGDGLLEDSWRYALDAARLDWMGNGDHDNGFHHEYMWWQIQKMTDTFHHAPNFVAAYTYERSVVYPNGHRNVILPRRGIRPLPRGELPGTPEKGTPDTKLLYAYLHKFGGMCSSHTSATGMGTDWRDNDPVVEPVVEIFQGCRNNYEHLGAPRSADKDRPATQLGGFQPAGFIWNALEKGYKLGFQSSSDHNSTHISMGVVLVEEMSRQGIIDAFKKRHSYAATDNIILEVRSGDHLMGDIFTTDKPPVVEISAHGTAAVAKVHVIRDNKYVYTAEPKQAQVKLRYTDMDAKPGQTSYYYVRVEQADGNLAWASPMWITYKPPSR